MDEHFYSTFITLPEFVKCLETGWGTEMALTRNFVNKEYIIRNDYT